MKNILYLIYIFISFCVSVWYIEEVKNITIYHGFSGSEHMYYIKILFWIMLLPIIIIELIIDHRKKSKEKLKKKKRKR